MRTNNGRGAGFNPNNRFLKSFVDYNETQPEDPDFEEGPERTQYLDEYGKSLLSQSDSPDLPQFNSINPYRGCEHGCIYCYARNSHEYWGFSAGLDFETKIVVKRNAPQLLEKLFHSNSYVPDIIHFSGNTDCYQPAEKKFMLTRQLLALCLKYRNPVNILTKNALILRDLDILSDMAELNLVNAAVSITSLNEDLRRELEPRTVTAKRRLEVIRNLTEAGVPTGIMSAPIIPGLNDHEIPAIIEEAAVKGARWAGYTIVRLNGAIAGIFEEWIKRVFPNKADKVLNQIRECHGGQLSDSRFGLRMRGEGHFAQQIAQLHHISSKKHFKKAFDFELDSSQFVRGGQFNLF